MKEETYLNLQFSNVESPKLVKCDACWGNTPPSGQHTSPIFARRQSLMRLIKEYGTESSGVAKHLQNEIKNLNNTEPSFYSNRSNRNTGNLRSRNTNTNRGKDLLPNQ